MSSTTQFASTLSSHSAGFESIYAEAQGDRDRIPWNRTQTNTALINWLNAVAPSIVRCGARVVVVGCGLGDDARILSRRGYEVTAFDCSPAAIEWAGRLDTDGAVSYHVADLFDLPQRWRHRFDLVVEINTIQALPVENRSDALRAIGDLLSPHGHMLVICKGREDDEPIAEDGPPWPLSEAELLEAASLAGLMQKGETSNFLDDSTDPPVRRIRGVFRRS